MPKINWYGISEYYFPPPGTAKTANCGLCGAEMKVKRNVLGPTSFAESMAGRKHLHDHFHCPNINKVWHKRIYRLKMDVHQEVMRRDPIGLRKAKRKARKEILKLLKERAAR